MENKMIKFGNWKYLKSNKTINYKRENFTYEVDLEKCSEREWIYHLQNKSWSDANCINDFIECLQLVKQSEPNLPVFTNPVANFAKNIQLSKIKEEMMDKPVQWSWCEINDL